MINEILDQIIGKIDKSEVEAIGLMGSYARGEAEKYSDIDIVCIVKNDKTEMSNVIDIIDNKYVVISYVTIAEMENNFLDPLCATEKILGIKQVQILYDPNQIFNMFKQRATTFKWSPKMQAKANEIASKQLVGWVEEVHKALQGLISNHVGKMINGLFGLTFGMFNVIRIQKAIMLDGENSLYQKVIEAYGKDSIFAKLSEKAFGLCQTDGLKERVRAGINLFDFITDQLWDIIREKDKKAILLAKQSIHNEL